MNYLSLGSHSDLLKSHLGSLSSNGIRDFKGIHNNTITHNITYHECVFAAKKVSIFRLRKYLVTRGKARLGALVDARKPPNFEKKDR